MKIIACAVLLWVPQAVPEDPKIAELIRALGSEGIQERDRAQKALLDAGKAALPQLRKAADDADPERKSRIRALISRMEWTPLKGRPVLQDLTDEERTFLGGAGLMTLSNAKTLLMSLEGHGSTAEFAKPEEGPSRVPIWTFIQPALFENAAVKGLGGSRPTTGKSEEYFDQRTLAAGNFLLTLQSHYENVVRGRSGILAYKYLPYALLETRETVDLSPTGLTWDAKEGVLPCLKQVMVPGPKNVTLKRTRTFEKDGKVTGAYYQFDWDGRNGRMETLRHLFVKERWALFIIFTW